jgi:Flp pilus assembly protein TadG
MMRALHRSASERGAVLVQSAIILLTLLAFSAFVVDYGVQWVARNQAQTAADAGALAGAIALAYDDTTYPPTVSPDQVKQSAAAAALCASGSSNCTASSATGNPVWPSEAGASSAVDVLFECPPGFTGKCVRVNVYRNGESGNVITAASWKLPRFVLPLLGAPAQGVKATASARYVAANATNCMRPFALPDKWIDNVNPGTFDHWNSDGTSKNPFDLYNPPTRSDFTGYRYPDNVGDLVTLIPQDTNNNTIAGNGWSLMVDLPDGAGGWLTGNSNTSTIAHCVGSIVKIGQYLPTENGGTGQINHYTTDLISQDSSARWDPVAKKVVSSYPTSPRVIPIAVFDVDEYQHRKVMSNRDPCIAAGMGGQCVKVVNILGFFVLDQPASGSVRGYLASDPGTFVTGTPDIVDDAAFLHVIQLVR